MSILEQVEWEEAQDRHDRKVAYIRLFPNPKDEGDICLSEHGYWGVVDHGQIWEMAQEENQCYLFYTLLYIPLDQVITQIKNSLSERKLPVQIITTFPFDALILSAINTNKHWKNLALKWIENGYPANDEIQLALCHGDKQSPYWLQWQKKRLGPILGIEDEEAENPRCWS